jgi:hypothetical protein
MSLPSVCPIDHCPFRHLTQVLQRPAAEAPFDKSRPRPNHGHLWQFNAAGQVVKFDHVTDTAQMIRMSKGQ